MEAENIDVKLAWNGKAETLQLQKVCGKRAFKFCLNSNRININRCV